MQSQGDEDKFSELLTRLAMQDQGDEDKFSELLYYYKSIPANSLAQIIQGKD
jgi:hypothetical protein